MSRPPEAAEWRMHAAIRGDTVAHVYPHKQAVRLAVDFREDVPIIEVVVTHAALADARDRAETAHRALLAAVKEGVLSFVFASDTRPDEARINALVDASNAALARLDALAPEGGRDE